MKIAFCGVVPLLLISPCFAQDAPEPASDAPNASNAQTGDAWKLVSFTESLVLDVAAHDGDCDAMKQVLRTSIQKNEDFLKSLDYATDQADEAAINRIHDSAVKLGTLLGTCYDDDELRNYLAFQIKR